MMRKVLKANMKMKKEILFLSLSSPLIFGGQPGRAGSRHTANSGYIKMSSVVPEMSLWVGRRKDCVGLMLLVLPLLPLDEGCRHPHELIKAGPVWGKASHRPS